MPSPRKRKPATKELTDENFGSSDEEDAGSGFESGLSDDEEMFFHGMDPKQDDPRLAKSEEHEEPEKHEEPKVLESVTSESESDEDSKQSPRSERWKDVDEEDVGPFQLKFAPARNPGPLLNCTQDYSPRDLFHLFFSSETILSLVDNTNKHAKIKKEMGKKYKWEPVEMIEFIKFCGIYVFMGIVRCPTIQDYWQVDSVWQTPFVRRVMGRDRFQTISWSLHISDPESDKKNNAKKGTVDYDRLAKIRPLMESMKMACKAFYHPKRNLSIDERMVPTKAKNGLKMYIKNKPHKWGYKLFVLCDSSNGYTCDFIVHAGRSPNVTSHGLSYDSVVSLVKPHFLGAGYILYCDNFYTSPALFRDLYKMKIAACGTVRENRTGFPKVQKNALTKASERGTMKWIREGPLLFVKWADTKEVSVCSTVHKAYAGDVTTRRQRQPDGTWETRSMPLPAAIKAYNKYMGGVDLSDQRLSDYTTRRKAYRWYKTFFFHFLDMAVVNAYLLHREHCAVKSRKPMTHLNFRKKLCEELCDVQVNKGPSTIVSPDHELQRLQGGRRVCKQCKEEGRRSDTSWQCARCVIPLCGYAARNCFRNWHLSSPSKAIKKREETNKTKGPLPAVAEISVSAE